MNTLKDRKPSPCGGVPRLWGSYEHMEVSGVGLSIWSRSTVSSCGPRARLATRGLVTLRVWFTLLLPAWPTWQASPFGFCWPPAQPFFHSPEEKGTQVTPSASHGQKLARVPFLTSLTRQMSMLRHLLTCSGPQFPCL